MKRFTRILFFFILTLSLPVGKLFDIFSWNSIIIKTEITLDRRVRSNRGICYYKLELGRIVNKAESAKQYSIVKRISLLQSIKYELDFQYFQSVFASIKPQIKEFFFNFKLCQDNYIIAA